MVLLALACACCLLAVPGLLIDRYLDAEDPRSLAASWDQAVTAWSTSRDERMQQAVGIPAEVEELVRSTLGRDGRLVLFLPYEHPTMVALLRLQYERLKNLVYPEPRFVRFATSRDELLACMDAEQVGRTLVVDGTQEDMALPVPGTFRVVHEQRLGGAGRLRYWLLEGLPR